MPTRITPSRLRRWSLLAAITVALVLATPSARAATAVMTPAFPHARPTNPAAPSDAARAVAGARGAPRAAIVGPGLTGRNLIRTIAGNRTVGNPPSIVAVATSVGLGAIPFFPDDGGIAGDRFGNFYFIDNANNRVRRISRDGRMTIVAGNGNANGPAVPGEGDGGPARAAPLHPNAIAVDDLGDIFLADGLHDGRLRGQRIRKITPDGIIHTIVGGGNLIGNPSGVPGTEWVSGGALDMAVDPRGNLFLMTSVEVWKVDTHGIITTVAGVGLLGGTVDSGDGGPASKAVIHPTGIAVDPHDNLYLAEHAFSVIRKITARTGIINLFAGKYGVGLQDTTGDGGPALNATFDQPVAVAADRFGNVYVTDVRGIRRIDQRGIVTHVTGFHPLQARPLPENVPAITSDTDVAATVGIAVDATGDLAFFAGDLADIAGTFQYLAPQIREVFRQQPPLRRATGGRAALQLTRVRRKSRLQVRASFLVPALCKPACTGRAELRNRVTNTRYPAVAINGDGNLVLGTARNLKLVGGRRTTFPIVISRVRLLKMRFVRRGGFLVGNTRLRIWITAPGGVETLLVRDGTIRLSIAKIRSGALPGLKALLR